MSGRRAKTERKKDKRAKEGQPQVFFEDALLAFLRNVGQTVGSIKSRGGGAQSLGPDALFACATEALDLARKATGAQGYLLAAAYALTAAMQQAGAWNLPPKPASEQAPESPEKPSEPPEGAAK